MGVRARPGAEARFGEGCRIEAVPKPSSQDFDLPDLRVHATPARRAEYPCRVAQAYRFTEYFEKEVLRKRPYLTKDVCIRVVEQPIRDEPQEGNRHRFWAAVPELGNRYLRVVTLADRVTIHNAFPDRRFKP
jgi:hypothetical protein